MATEATAALGDGERVSFARLGWQLASQDRCAVCDGASRPCEACASALDDLIADERVQRTTDLYDQITVWKRAGLLSTSASRRLWDALERAHSREPTGAVVSTRSEVNVPETSDHTRVAAEASEHAHAAAEASPARTQVRRSFRWRELGESLLAERTLNTLLGLGAFLILASALVISVVNPTRLSLVPHLGFLAGTMALFSVSGYVCYARMRLARAGEALLAIAAAFIPLDVWSLGGADGLGWSGAEIWLLGSAVALPVYALLYLVLPGRVLAWLVAIAGESLLLGSLNAVHVPDEWMLCAGVALAVMYTACSSRLHAPRWSNLRTAFSGLALVATPPALLAVLALKFDANSSSISEYAVGATWWLGVGVYALSARVQAKPLLAVIAAWLAPVAYLLTLTRAAWDPAWYGVWLVALAVPYTFYAIRVRRPGGRNHAAYIASVLSLGGLIWSAQAGVTWAWFAAALADGFLAGWVATELRSPRVAGASVAALGASFWLGLVLVGWPGWTTDRPWPWLVLAIGLAIGAELQLRASGEQRRPVTTLIAGRGTWRAVFAPALFDASLVASLIALAVALVRDTSGEMLVSSVVLTIVGAAAATVSWTRRSGAFVYPASMMFAVAVVPAMSAMFPGARSQAIGLALAALGTAFGYIGHRLGDGAGAPYRRPLWLIGLVLTLLGPAVALIGGDAPRQALTSTACAVVFGAALAVIRRPVWSIPLAVWSVAGYALVLRAVLPNPRPEYLLGAFVLPACVALLVAEIAAYRAKAGAVAGPFALARFTRIPWAIPPLAVALVTFAVSMLSIAFDSAIGTAVAAIYAVALGVVATRHGRLPGERWAALVLLALAIVDPYDLGRATLEWAPPMIVGFGVVLALLSVAVSWTRRANSVAWRVPLEWMAIVLAAIGELEASNRISSGLLHTASITTGLCAVVLLTVAYARGARAWAYGGIGALVLAGLIEIASAGVSQPQAYALPVGIYLTGLAWLEWRRGDPSRLKAPLELAALLVLLGTTVLQGSGFIGDGMERYPYDVALIVEGMAVVGLGAAVRWWRSLFTGAGAVIVAVLILLAEPLATVNTWYLVGSLGLMLVGGVVFLERRRQQIPVWFDGWRQQLETWA